MLFFAESIEWPDEDDFPVIDEVKDLTTALLMQNPLDRLGTGGTHEVKEHIFFEGLDWDTLLRQKAKFIPALEHEEDTTYFDSMYHLPWSKFLIPYLPLHILIVTK